MEYGVFEFVSGIVGRLYERCPVFVRIRGRDRMYAPGYLSKQAIVHDKNQKEAFSHGTS